MFNFALASAAALAMAGLARSQGAAVVVNQCNYNVHLTNVPAAGGGYSQISQVLPQGGQYSQTWTELSNKDGWSIKLSKSDSMENIMQYEYTYLPGQPIWFDLSDVNGNPWNGNWEITASDPNCKPKQQAYRFSTDDAYGMQACPADSEITVTLCSGTEGGAPSGSQSVPASTSSAAASTAAPSSGPSSAPYSAPAPPSSSQAQATSSFTTPSQSTPTWWGPKTWVEGNGKVELPASSSAPSPTTLITSTSAVTSVVVSSEAPGVTVTEIATQVVTQIVTATAGAKRHEHHRHPHHRAI